MRGDKGERRKKELLQIAYRMFIQKGYDKTSIDEIIAEANIAKGTYYYYFPSKEATLEAVIDMMISEETERAAQVLSAPIPLPQKIVAIIMSYRPKLEETELADMLERQENIVMHEKMNRCLVEKATPLLVEVVNEGIEQGIFSCNHVEERVRMILFLTRNTFDENSFTERDVEVFIDVIEKILGAEKGTMEFVKTLIGNGG